MRSVQDDNSSFSNEPLGSFNTSQGLSFYMRPKNQNNLSEDGAGFLPSNPSSRVRPSTAFRPATARILGGQNPERKTPFPFSKEISPPPNQKCKECFFFRGCRVKRGGGGAIIRAYNLDQSHHALRACLIRGSAGNESELFGIMTTRFMPHILSFKMKITVLFLLLILILIIISMSTSSHLISKEQAIEIAKQDVIKEPKARKIG